MNLKTEILGEQVFFRIADFDPKYQKVMDMCFYQKDAGGYYKAYPADYPNLDIVRENFVRHGMQMFDQLGYFCEIPWEKGLSAFAGQIEGKGIDWWLTGSCAACVRGIAINPHDVDIMVNSTDIPLLMKLFKDDIFEPIVDTQGWVTKDFGVLFMHCRIDIASDPDVRLDIPEPADCGPYAREHLETVKWNNYAIKVPPLSLSLAINKRRERWDRVKLIEEYQLSIV